MSHEPDPLLSPMDKKPPQIEDDIFGGVFLENPEDESIWLQNEPTLETGEVDTEPDNDKEYFNLDQNQEETSLAMSEMVLDDNSQGLIAPKEFAELSDEQQFQKAGSSGDEDEYKPDGEWHKENAMIDAIEGRGSVVIVVPKILTRAMLHAIQDRLPDIFAILIDSETKKNFIYKVEHLTKNQDVLIRAGKVHFNPRKVALEEVEREDGYYKQVNYKVVAKLVERKDVSEPDKINLTVEPILLSDVGSFNSCKPNIISRKDFAEKANLYKNVKIMPFAEAKKYINREKRSAQVEIKVEPQEVTKKNRKKDFIIDENGNSVKRTKRPYVRRAPKVNPVVISTAATPGTSSSKPSITIRIKKPGKKRGRRRGPTKKQKQAQLELMQEMLSESDSISVPGVLNEIEVESSSTIENQIKSEGLDFMDGEEGDEEESEIDRMFD